MLQILENNILQQWPCVSFILYLRKHGPVLLVEHEQFHNTFYTPKFLKPIGFEIFRMSCSDHLKRPFRPKHFGSIVNEWKIA